LLAGEVAARRASATSAVRMARTATAALGLTERIVGFVCITTSSMLEAIFAGRD
jgi:hypothetical protein